ncbi:metal-dependent hydrolase family protein [Phenylobacterium sp.]|uniref:metal-dependent hydrolase family protein n=1 Tax=Phenylobacterium sp. TaxID=1871053 RepID=UPI002FC78BE4
MKAIFIAALGVAWLAGAAAQAQTAPAAGDTTLVLAGQLLDRPGQAARGPSTVVVRGGKVVEVRDGFATATHGERVIDLRDQFVLPGLMDMHVHLYIPGDPLKARLEATTRDFEDRFVLAAEAARWTLEAGFTTVRDMGGDPHGMRALRDAINRGALPGPTVVFAGSMISVTGGHGDQGNGLSRDHAALARANSTNLCDGPESCRRAVREQISMGADVIKFAATGGVNSNVAGGVGRQMFDDEMRAIVETAHMFGRKVGAHAHAKDGIEAALRAGVDSIEHGAFTEDSTVALFKQTGAYLVPTELAAFTALEQARRGDRPPAVLEKAEATAKVAQANHRRAIMGGVKIATGSDSGVSKNGDNAREFKLMVAAGMTPMQVIKAATVNGADLLGRSSTIGTIEVGKDADLVAVQGSPLEDITRLERVAFVMRRGAVIKLGGQRQAFPPNPSSEAKTVALGDNAGRAELALVFDDPDEAY